MPRDGILSKSYTSDVVFPVRPLAEDCVMCINSLKKKLVSVRSPVFDTHYVYIYNMYIYIHTQYVYIYTYIICIYIHVAERAHIKHLCGNLLIWRILLQKKCILLYADTLPWFLF